MGGTPSLWQAGQWMQFQGGDASHVPFLTSGVARVFQADRDGHEITLYRVEPGDFCTLGILAALTGACFPAAMVAETDTAGLLVPAFECCRAMQEHAHFRQQVFGTLAARASHLLGLLSQVAFTPIDQRLAALLLDRAFSRHELLPLTVTHRELAAELGTAREVVSRTLGAFEQEGALILERGRIQFPPGSEEFLRRKAAAQD